MSKTYSAGIVTAYGAAKRAGYQGTYEDFCRQQAEYAESAAAVEQAKTTAVNAAATATTKAGEATTAATAAQTAKAQTEQAASQALTDIAAARSGAISAVQTEGATQTANATAQAQAAATSANTASAKASEASASATSAGLSATNAATSATSAAQSASAAQSVLESIPEEYSDLSEDVDKLKADLAAIVDSEIVTSKNLFNPNADGVIVGKYLATNGNPTTLDGWNISDFIDVSNLTAIVASVWNTDDTYRTYGKLSFMHTYNANKGHIAKVWDTSTNGVYTVGENVAYIKFCWQPKNELASGRKMMVESGSAHSASYEEYFEPYTSNTLKPDVISDGSIEESKLSAELQNKIDSVVPSTNDNIVCWGDSLTYSQYSTNVKYPARLATLTGKTVKNFGMPGANSMDISGLQGGMPIYLEPFTLPADTSSVTVSLIDVNSDNSYIGLLHHMPRPGWVNDVQAMNNYWIVDGIPTMLIYSSGVMKLYRLNAGESAITFDRPVKLTSIHDYAKEQIQIFWVGTNDAPTTAEKAQRTVDVIKNMVNYYGGKRYLVLGMTVKSYADATNDLMGQTFGNHYVDVKDYLIKYGLADSNLTPTEQDTSDISNSVVPTSLRYDSVHFNDYGYTAIGNCVFQHGKDLGYWD